MCCRGDAGGSSPGSRCSLFVIQSLPVVTAIIPLFILFAELGLVDTLGGIVIIYVGGTMSVAIWMMAAYFDSIPISLEEAAWMDGCSVFGSFSRVVLRNSLPGVLSTAIFAFLLAWNDYLVAVIFLRADQNYTLPIGLQTFFQQNADRLGAGDERRGRDDDPADRRVRRPQPLLQRRRHRWVSGRTLIVEVGRPGAEGVGFEL